MKSIRIMFFSLVLLSAYSSSSFSAVLNVENGILLGATNVNVNGSLYDVSFIDGSCINLFDGCADLSDFFFTDVASGQAANLALLQQVLIDSSAGEFDSNPALTNGCNFSFCDIFSPVGDVFPNSTTLSIVFLRNFIDDSSDFGTGSGTAIRAADFTPIDAFDTKTYAIWSGSTISEVPIPGASWLFFSGLISLIGLSKRKSVSQYN